MILKKLLSIKGLAETLLTKIALDIKDYNNVHEINEIEEIIDQLYDLQNYRFQIPTVVDLSHL